MEGQVAEPLRHPENPGEVLNRIIANEILGDNMDVPTLFQDVNTLIKLSAANGPRTSGYLKSVGNYRQVKSAILDEVNKADAIKDGTKVLENIKLAQVFGMDKLPKTWAYFSYLQNEYGDNVKQKKPKRRHLKGRLALAAATTLSTAVGFLPHQAEPIPPTIFKDSQRDPIVLHIDTESQKAPQTGSPVKLETKLTATPQPPENLFNEVIKPFIDEALKRRAERAKNDPEYYNRVDKELNQNRINILLFGYGEEWTGGNMDQPTFGSHSIFSINLKTGKIDLVSPTHDTRAPEIEQFLKKSGKEARPTRMDRAYDIGGYDLMREVLEDATGLSVDYQIRLEDTFIKYLVDNLGGITVDIPFDVNTKEFRDEGKLYPPHQFSKGLQKMDGAKALQFIKAWSDPVDPTKERNIRKHLAMRALFDQVKQKTKEKDLLFGVKMLSLFASESVKGNIGFDFDEKQFIFPMLGNLGKLGGLDLSIDKTVFVVDPAIGDGGVQWITANAAQNPLTKADIDKGLYQDLAMEIPFNANPYSSNLVRDYWKSVRDLIKSKLSNPQQPVIARQEAAPTATITPTPSPSPTPTPPPTPTETPTPKPTPTPEVKTFKKDIFRGQIAPEIYKKVETLRAERAKNDPEYRERINHDLNEGRINILITGGREDDPLTDTIQVLSYHIASNSVHIISIPRDLQSPEVLRKTKNPRNSRINEALGQGGPDLLRGAVENATALSVDFYFHANFDVLEDFINQTVGTIDVELDRPITDNEYPTADNGYKRIYYPKGVNTLTGEQALEVARSRHDSSDYDRAQRQQKIMEAFIRKLLSENFINQIRYLKTINDIWYQKVQGGTLKPDFDINQLFFSDLLGLAGQTPQIVWDRVVGGIKIAEIPTVFATGISNKNFVVGAGVPGLSITKISGGNPSSPNPRKDYWNKTRNFSEKFLTENEGEPPDEEEITVEIPAT